MSHVQENAKSASHWRIKCVLQDLELLRTYIRAII